ncbi:MAG: Uma2 family endonuclease [Planctomycetaceae bacterium]|nr:Uma2 family endonuclease [Planctomycetaceae bacterium]
MSTITPLQPLTATQPLWVPALPTLYRLSIAQYEAMVAFVVFTKRDRLHLINGFLVAKMTEYPPHAAACDGVRFAIEALLATGWYVRSDKPLKIPNCISVPEPDVVVARGTWRDYSQRHSEPSQVPLVIEVSSLSLHEDRWMALVYGRGGVAVYWIVNLIDRQVEVHTDPGPDGYRTVLVFSSDQAVPLFLEGTELGRITMTDILPRELVEG